MARMACAVATAPSPPWPLGAEPELVAPSSETGKAERSIDSEAAGSGWHESSWQLRRGLQVDENPPPEAIPPEWQWRWWLAANAG